MASPFNFQDVVTWVPAKEKLGAFAIETKTGKHAVTVRLGRDGNDLNLKVLSQKIQGSRFLNLFKRKVHADLPNSQNRALFSRTYQNIDIAKFLEEKKKLEGLIKAKVSLNEIIATVERDLSTKDDCPKDSNESEPTNFLPNADPVLSAEPDANNDVEEPPSNDKLKELKREIEILQGEIDNAQKSMETCSVDRALLDMTLKVVEVASQKLRGIDASLADLKTHKDTAPLIQSTTGLNANIQDLHRKLLQSLLDECKAKATQIKAKIALHLPAFQKSWEKELEFLEKTLGDAASIQEAKDKENELDRLLEEVELEQKKRLLDEVQKARSSFGESLCKPLFDSLSSQEWLAAINGLRKAVLTERNKAWDLIAFKVQNVLDTAALRDEIVRELKTDELLMKYLNRPPRASSYMALALDAASLVTSYAAHMVSPIVSPIAKAFMPFEPLALVSFRTFNEAAASYLKVIFSKITEKTAFQGILGVFLACQRQKKLETIDAMEELCSAAFQAGSATKILRRAQKIMETLRVTQSELQDESESENGDVQEISSKWLEQQKLMGAEFPNLHALHLAALFHENNKAYIAKSLSEIEVMTGNEKVQAKAVVQELENKLIAELEWLSELDPVTPKAIDVIRYKLEDFQFALERIGKVEMGKAGIRKDIEKIYAKFDAFIDSMKEKTDAIEEEYGVRLVSAKQQLDALRADLQQFKEEGFNLSLQELISLRTKVKTIADLHECSIKRNSGIDEAYEAKNALQSREEEAADLKAELESSTGLKSAQIFNAQHLDWRLKGIAKEKKERLNGQSLSMEEVKRRLRQSAYDVAFLVSKTRKLADQSLQQQVRNFEKLEVELKAALNQPLNSETAKAHEEDLKETKTLLIATKGIFFKNLEFKIQNHKKAMAEVCRPLHAYPEILTKAKTLIAEVEAAATARLNEKPQLKNHLEKALATSRSGRYETEKIESDVLETINSELLSRYESIVDDMIEANLKHAVLIRESTLAAGKAKHSFQAVQAKATAFADDLNENDQILERVVLEQTLTEIENDLKEIEEKEDFAKRSSWNIFPWWNRTTYEITKATEDQKKLYGKLSAKLLKAIDRSKSAPELSIPDQLLLLGSVPKEKRSQIQEELRSSFAHKMEELIESGEEVLNNYEAAFSDVVGRFYVPENGRFRRDIEEVIRTNRERIDAFKKEHSNTFSWVPGKALEFFTFSYVKMTESISTMTPSVMRSYEKEIAQFTKNLKNTLESSFPILALAKSHKNYENAFLKAKSENASFRASGQFWLGFKIEKQAILINQAFKREWDRPKVSGIAELKSLQAELIRCASSIDLYITRMRTEAHQSMSLSLQLEKLNQESPASREEYEVLRTNIEALKEEAIETIKSQLEIHREDLEKMSTDFREIVEKFQLPRTWVSRIDEGVRKELTLHADHIKTPLLFGLDIIERRKKIDALSAFEAAAHASKVIQDCKESLERVYRSKGIDSNVGLKALRESYKKYKAAAQKVESAKDSLIRHGQYLYIHKMEKELKAAEAAFKALDRSFPLPTFVARLKEALNVRCAALSDAERLASTSRPLTAKEQASQLPPDFQYGQELCFFRAGQIRTKIEKEQADLLKQMELMATIPFLPARWGAEVVGKLEICKDQLQKAEIGKMVRGREWFGLEAPPTLKSLEEMTPNESAHVEEEVEVISRRIVEIGREYDIKDLMFHYEARLKLLQEAEDLKPKVAIAQLSAIERLIERVETSIRTSIQEAGTVSTNMRAFADTLRIQNAALSAGIKEIQQQTPSSGAERLLALDEGSPEYIKCKQGLQEFILQQLASLHKAIDQYDRKIDEMEKKLQSATNAEAVLTETWKREAYQWIRGSKRYALELQEGFPTRAADGARQIKAFNAMNKHELVQYEKVVMRYVGAQTSFVPEKDKNQDVYTKMSALSILEGHLHLVEMEKIANAITSQVSRLKANISHAEKSQQDLQKLPVLQAGAHVFKEVIKLTAGRATSIAHSQSLVTALEFALAGMTRMNSQYSDRYPPELEEDPWTALYLRGKNVTTLKGMAIQEAIAALYENSFEISFKTYFNDPSRGSGSDIKIHKGYTPTQLKEQTEKCINEFITEARHVLELIEDELQVRFIRKQIERCESLLRNLAEISIIDPKLTEIHSDQDLFVEYLTARTDIFNKIFVVLNALEVMKVELLEAIGMTSMPPRPSPPDDDHKHDNNDDVVELFPARPPDEERKRPKEERKTPNKQVDNLINDVD